ncbi:MAG: glucoamylase family protein, partial [Polyangiaceae bacterium]
MVEETQLDFDESALVSFVQAYQVVASLTIAELWALPAMLRIATLVKLVRSLDVFFPPPHALRVNATKWNLVAPEVGVERAVRTLRLLSEVDWKSFVQRTSAVEAALLEDPSGVYARMDFSSRDAYRSAVESLAWDTARAEPEVARVAVGLATEGLTKCPADDQREGHVGYYLVDGGLPQLKARIAYQAHGIERLRQSVLSHPKLSYFGSVGSVLLALLALVLVPAARRLSPTVSVLAALLVIVPLVSVAVAFTNRWVNRLLVPRLLPKLDFALGAPADCRTLLVIPALVQTTSDFDHLLAQLELHYLSAPDPSVAFALLTDHVDSPQMPDDSALLAHARATVDALNTKYAAGAIGPFHVLHREAKWNEGESCFMGCERKRGKLEELNRLLRGDQSTTFKEHLGDGAGLDSVRFVITLDSDTQLPLGAIRRLIGLAAHPLNTARFDPVTERVTAGYTVAQPRVEPSPVDGTSSLFSRFWCGDTSLDIYSSAASDVYQDLFGSGAYVGKGIYEVDTFARSVDGRAPPNAIASHDLFEGVHGRAALVTDIVVFEQYPQSYLAFVRRMHRWIRGDWQLLPWLFPRVPWAGVDRVRNRLGVVDRWKIIDNLRRSLLAPNIVILFFFAWSVLPAHVMALLVVPLMLPLAIVAPAFFHRDRKQALGRWLLGLVFLPAEAWVASDAIIRAVVRMTITRKHLLQWVTAADTTLAFAKGSRRLFWRDMGPAAAATTGIGLFLAWQHPAAIPFGVPILLIWLISPELARWVSAPEAAKKALSLSAHTELRHLARRTWLFFETFVGPGDQWLAPDNFQEEPGDVVAHRTSPTNIGLMLIADLSAYDLGYIGRAELSALVHSSIETLSRLERYRGHWLNWYDTRTLEPLLPKYVSTVDSGNLAAALLILANGCREAATKPALRPIRFKGLSDTLDLLEQTIGLLAVSRADTLPPIAAMRLAIDGARNDVSTSKTATIALFSEVALLEAALLKVLERTTTTHDTVHFREVQTWLDRFCHQLRSIQGDVAAQSDTLRDELLALAGRVDALRNDVDFTFLFDAARKLFRIGYNETSDRLDANYYDLLASEARLASYLAVVQAQVPTEHWLTLGRPVTRIRGEAALLSWGGTMFEFLMPTLFMRSQERTLLQQTSELAVVAQIEHGKKLGIPWGVSESGYAQLDAQNNYQYRSFGVPGLGLRRGLEEDRVIAPYACVLALPFRPNEAIRNIKVLQGMGGAGLYGLYEAIDYDETRVIQTSNAIGKPSLNHSVVRSHMAHHQGMILAALNNALNHDVLVDRFHADPRVKNGEPLLSERVPSVRISENLAAPTKETIEPTRTEVPSYPDWTPRNDHMQLALLSNGRLMTAITDSGAGFTAWNGLAIVRGSIDPTCDVGGTWIYLRDEERNRMWSAAPAPTRARRADDEVVFSAHQVAFHHREDGISVRMEISCGALDDVEVRHVTLHNETTEPRMITLTTYAEPVLEPSAASDRQPAFSRMFVACEALPAQNALLATRRARTAKDPTAVLVQSLVWDDPAISWAGAETDRRAFVGRRRDARAPRAMVGVETNDEHATLDPVLALSVKIELSPGAHAEVALVTVVGKTREAALDVARRFGSLRAARWVAHDARMEAARRLAVDGVSPSLLPSAMALVSKLLAPSPGLKAAPAQISGALAAKNELWSHRISGDFPLVVVRVRDQLGNALVKDIIATYRFLRAYGQRVELVFLDDALTGYQTEEPGSIRNLLVTAGV